MKGDKGKTREQPTNELEELRRRIAELEKTEAGLRQPQEAELRKSEERYRDLVEKERDIVYSLDDKGNVSFASPATEARLYA
jgi:PAS domain-containing protein